MSESAIPFYCTYFSQFSQRYSSEKANIYLQDKQNAPGLGAFYFILIKLTLN
jgi:hypothetical protein